ncbi:MAG TPA: aldo/keto reductase, partial [Saprospiraceae bacterium]|nr:aldo/keto reductase [Saprospiraceae bacterium]
RMGLDYVDIFYPPRPDPDTPLEETMGALAQVVRQGKALYVGISQYSPADTARAAQLLREMGTPLLIHQPRYNMLDRWVEGGLLDELERQGAGAIAFSPLEQGVLTDRYLHGIPDDSRAGRDGRHLNADKISPVKLEQARRLDAIARQRGQSLAQMAIAWLLKDSRVSSVLVGASRPAQLLDSLGALDAEPFREEELRQIADIIGA